jgi:hypothetical protein
MASPIKHDQNAVDAGLYQLRFLCVRVNPAPVAAGSMAAVQK